MRALILSGKQAFDNGLGVSFEVFFFFFFWGGCLVGTGQDSEEFLWFCKKASDLAGNEWQNNGS
jgi:hypothetical protein